MPKRVAALPKMPSNSTALRNERSSRYMLNSCLVRSFESEHFLISDTFNKAFNLYACYVLNLLITTRKLSILHGMIVSIFMRPCKPWNSVEHRTFVRLKKSKFGFVRHNIRSAGHLSGGRFLLQQEISGDKMFMPGSDSRCLERLYIPALNMCTYLI